MGKSNVSSFKELVEEMEKVKMEYVELLSVRIYVTLFSGDPVADVYEGKVPLEVTKELIEFLGLEFLNFHQDRTLVWSGSSVGGDPEVDDDPANFDVFLCIGSATPSRAVALGATRDDLENSDMPRDMLAQFLEPTRVVLPGVGVAKALRRAASWQRHRARQHEAKARWARESVGMMSQLEAHSRSFGSEKAAERCYKVADRMDLHYEEAKREGLLLSLRMPGEHMRGERGWRVYSDGEHVGDIEEMGSRHHPDAQEHSDVDVIFCGEDSLGGMVVRPFQNRWFLALAIVEQFRAEVRANTARAEVRRGLVSKSV
jgi:hypothetical protein